MKLQVTKKNQAAKETSSEKEQIGQHTVGVPEFLCDGDRQTEDQSKARGRGLQITQAEAMPSSREPARSEKTSRSAKESKKSSKLSRSGKTGVSQQREKSRKSAKSSRGEKSGISKRNPSERSGKKSGKSHRKSKKQVNGVRLIHSHGEIIVKEADLVAVSVLMKTRQAENRLAKAISLKEFSSECVFLLAEYIKKRTIKAQISFYTLSVLLKLSKTFMMEELHKQMEEVLLNAAGQSAVNLLQALLVNDVAPVSRETEAQLLNLGASRFLDLVRLPDFHMMPLNQFLQIFGSCELNVPHELVAADAALLWLAKQSSIETQAPAVFALVRSGFLGKMERVRIVERMAALKFPQTVVRVVKVLLDSRHNNRVCLTPEHIARHLPRCGVADGSVRPSETTLPLSRPTPQLIRQDRRHRSLSSKCSKSGRSSSKPRKEGESSRRSKKSQHSSGRSQKSRTNTAEQSGRSQKSKKRKSAKNVKSKKSRPVPIA